MEKSAGEKKTTPTCSSASDSHGRPLVPLNENILSGGRHLKLSDGRKIILIRQNSRGLGDNSISPIVDHIWTVPACNRVCCKNGQNDHQVVGIRFYSRKGSDPPLPQGGLRGGGQIVLILLTTTPLKPLGRF